MGRNITIGVTNECQSCDLMKYKIYTGVPLPYCTLFKTFLQFREYENDDWIVKPCYECMECSNGNTHYFTTGEWRDENEEV